MTRFIVAEAQGREAMVGALDDHRRERGDKCVGGLHQERIELELGEVAARHREGDVSEALDVQLALARPRSLARTPQGYIP